MTLISVLEMMWSCIVPAHVKVLKPDSLVPRSEEIYDASPEVPRVSLPSFQELCGKVRKSQFVN